MRSAGQPVDRRRGRWVLVLLALLFLSGIIASFVLVETGWRPTKTKNYGELVQPARPIDDVGLVRLGGGALRFAELQGKWTLVYFGSAECPKPCIDNLYKMRQITAAQGKEAHRVQRLFVLTDARGLDGLHEKLKDYPGMEVVTGDPEEVRRLAEQFRLPAGSPSDGLQRVYVVDPLGNLMMSYPADADPRGMNKDLGFLLKASQIG
ncbi:cytochrome C oxidase subunit I [Sulfurifustis variabilis]|uniref:Cytochrome C oxidase subunit I n=1 Tax=Sulfurifustis variabilis TaxID=1675686 RepID=A0A1B4V3H0_9GAMM|nr:SCO family protein [Sulfurifustis variabilis]BAU47042.1 cytochrome C oxidase subunit I [Sulfurifustis variabilis]